MGRLESGKSGHFDGESAPQEIIQYFYALMNMYFDLLDILRCGLSRRTLVTSAEAVVVAYLSIVVLLVCASPTLPGGSDNEMRPGALLRPAGRIVMK